ncbi:MAG: DUF6265 family protein [Saprospiraceae bacterium]|nr:DUF6265 family protein [Saprospiraceae bacterium]
MKIHWIITLLFFLALSTTPVDLAAQSDEWDKLRWLLGKWQNMGVKPGQIAWEEWKETSDSDWSGIGLTLEGSDTVFVEWLRIVDKDQALYYVAEVSHNEEPVYFKMIDIGVNYFEVENPEHDFPKKIKYEYKDNQLNVVISGDGKEVPFSFVRL